MSGGVIEQLSSEGEPTDTASLGNSTDPSRRS